MSTTEKKHRARALFVKSSLTQKEIASQVGITEKTMSKWTNEGNWQQERDSQSITKTQLLQESMQQLQRLNQHIDTELKGIITKELSDAKASLRKEIELFSEQPLYQYVEVCDEFLEWLGKNHPAQLQKFSELSMEFLDIVNKRQK